MKYFIDIKDEWKTLVKQKMGSYKELNEEVDFDNLEVDIHNASWCPDCEREVTDLFAWLNVVESDLIKLNIFEYEDKELYKSQKLNGCLSIKCLPTIIFKKSGLELLRVEEISDNNFLNEIQKLYTKLGKK
ncbi:hypothetical protein [Bacteriovorax sp. Seq25_V]|uniref:hypothetical protein n=1 Tax=Bacteriovorax sp. Seq25_V TaxID=1201288 RepID=UPI00038A0B99|nr:hypothetical protein [Bacteriovorax sp. Seq25_V]EQC47474.1 hypothetical protein M900_1002 [Bacteriovorax sp. Seq25_V]